jgi:hypothetical protein
MEVDTREDGGTFLVGTHECGFDDLIPECTKFCPLCGEPVTVEFPSWYKPLYNL